MRLLKRLAGSEGLLDEVQLEDGPPVGLVWTDGELRVDAGGLEEGQYIATDLYLGERVDQLADGEAGRTVLSQVRERVTENPQDLGVVYLGYEGGAGTRRIGRVMEMDGALVSWEKDAVVAPAAGVGFAS